MDCKVTREDNRYTNNMIVYIPPYFCFLTNSVLNCFSYQVTDSVGRHGHNPQIQHGSPFIPYNGCNPPLTTKSKAILDDEAGVGPGAGNDVGHSLHGITSGFFAGPKKEPSCNFPDST